MKYFHGNMTKASKQIALKISTLSLLGLVFLLCSGFTLPSPSELKKDLKEELKKIREKTPGAKQLAYWRDCYDQAVQAIEEAEWQGAERYAPEAWNEALQLLSKAKEYARKKSYQKAAFLARKAREAGTRAKEQAEKARAEALAEAQKALDDLKEKLDKLSSEVPRNARGLVLRFNELVLQWTDLVHAKELEQFEDLKKGVKKLERKIKELSRQLTDK